MPRQWFIARQKYVDLLSELTPVEVKAIQDYFEPVEESTNVFHVDQDTTKEVKKSMEEYGDDQKVLERVFKVFEKLLETEDEFDFCLYAV